MSSSKLPTNENVESEIAPCETKLAEVSKVTKSTKESASKNGEDDSPKTSVSTGKIVPLPSRYY
jgi:hypothetical protein